MRKSATLVPETDAGWVQFWELYPRRIAKLKARKAWAALNPSPELVEQIVRALEWQVPAYQWDGASQEFAPYPATYLNNERWTDERRVVQRPASVPWQCPHLEQCSHQAMCRIKTEVGPQKYPVKA